MKLAIVGCGYVAEFYAATLAHYPRLTLAGAFDRDADRLRRFAERTGCRAYPSLDGVLADGDVELVVNLTNPRSHFAINKASLEAGKHVYCEKPLAMTTGDAQALAALAASRRRALSAAPCSLLSPTAQTLWKAVRDGAIGTVRVAYANFDDGMIAPKLAPWQWTNESGVPWPAKDEFEIGCTYEHAGYVLTWLTAMLGPAVRLAAFSSCQMPEKGIPVDAMAPDFTVGGIAFAGGAAARVTCGLVAPRDKSITLVGDDGVLFVANVRDDNAPVMRLGESGRRLRTALIHHTPGLEAWLESRLPAGNLAMLQAEPVPPVSAPGSVTARPDKPVDFCRGIDEAAEAIAAGRTPRLSAEFAVHVVELIERLQHPERFADARLSTGFPPIEPMPWT